MIDTIVGALLFSCGSLFMFLILQKIAEKPEPVEVIKYIEVDKKKELVDESNAKEWFN